MEQKLCPGCEESVIDKLPGCPLQCRTVQCMAYKKKPVYDYEIMPIVWIISGPGCGKESQSRNIISSYGFHIISPGQLLRDEMAKDSVRAKCLNSVIGRGGLAPNDLVLELLKEAIEAQAAKGPRGIIVSGFPREKSQGLLFERSVGRVSLILYLEASVETMFNTMSKRTKAADRIDETPDAIKLRLETHMRHSEAVFELYKYRLVKINADKPSEQVFAQVMNAMDQLISNVEELKTKKIELENQAREAAIAAANPKLPLKPKATKTIKPAELDERHDTSRAASETGQSVQSATKP